LAKEFNVSTNAVREELNQLTRAQLLKSEKNGRNVFYRANTEHALFPELRSIVSKAMGVDQVVDGILTRLGDLKHAYIIDDYAQGKDNGVIDLLLVGNFNHHHLYDLITKTEKYIHRKIRSLLLSEEEFDQFKLTLSSKPHLLVWCPDKYQTD
jgi:hypothetical protein